MPASRTIGEGITGWPSRSCRTGGWPSRLTSDLFYPKFIAELVAEVFAVMTATPQHTYQVLTKRPRRPR
jgi:hypothetical protein